MAPMSQQERALFERQARPGQRPIRTGEGFVDAFNNLRWEVEVLEHRLRRIGLDSASDERFDSQFTLVEESLAEIKTIVASTRQILGSGESEEKRQ